MTDDTGFGVSSTFGGTIPSPGLDRMAAKGLRYTNLDLDSALLAGACYADHGRNHGSMGFGVVSEPSTDYPGYDNIMTGQDDRPDPEGSWLLDILVWQGPTTPRSFRRARAGPSTKGRPVWASTIFTALSAADTNQASRTYGVHDLSIRAGTSCDRSSSPTTESAPGDPPGTPSSRRGPMTF